MVISGSQSDCNEANSDDVNAERSLRCAERIARCAGMQVCTASKFRSTGATCSDFHRGRFHAEDAASDRHFLRRSASGIPAVSAPRASRAPRQTAHALLTPVNAPVARDFLGHGQPPQDRPRPRRNLSSRSLVSRKFLRQAICIGDASGPSNAPGSSHSLGPAAFLCRR